MMNRFTIAATKEGWHQQAEAAKAEHQPIGRRREALVREARRLRTAAQIDELRSSSELQPPKYLIFQSGNCGTDAIRVAGNGRTLHRPVHR